MPLIKYSQIHVRLASRFCVLVNYVHINVSVLHTLGPAPSPMTPGVVPHGLGDETRLAEEMVLVHPPTSQAFSSRLDN
jgi:hypothetical protein